MNVLFLAPHPFYQDRGTPIAVNLILRVLSERGELVDVITYHEGSDVHYDGVTLFRIPSIPFTQDIRPGFSIKKLVCDAVMAVRTFQQLWRNQYHVIHAVEESVFIALILRLIFRVPYVYDMDSSLAQQMIEKHPALGPLLSIFTYLESLAVKHAKAVVPVCDALRDLAVKHGATKVCVLHDVPLLKDSQSLEFTNVDVSELPNNRFIIMYVGNLEVYQGIDLLLDSFSRVTKEVNHVDLVIVGGVPEDIQKYQQKSRTLGIETRVFFLGAQPIDRLSSFLEKANILVSPRKKGNNTPMKLYSYLQSGKPILATNLPTHTQVLDEQVAVLTEPHPDSFAQGLLALIKDEALAEKIGQAGKQLVNQKFSYRVFREKVNDLYGWLTPKVEPHTKGATLPSSPSHSSHSK
ncbi:MAG: glycosyltransferase family 4 protein [Nitrospirales bacterium]